MEQSDDETKIKVAIVLGEIVAVATLGLFAAIGRVAIDRALRAAGFRQDRPQPCSCEEGKDY